jgi:hypothetical protein
MNADLDKSMWFGGILKSVILKVSRLCTSILCFSSQKIENWFNPQLIL